MLHKYTAGNDILSLIPVTEADIEQMRIWRNDDNARFNFINSEIIERDGQKRWFESYKSKPNDYMFIIKETPTGKSIGFMGLYNFTEDKKEAEFGRFVIGEASARGKGYGKISCSLITDLAFDKLNLEKIKLTVLDENVSAKKVYEAVGYKSVGKETVEERLFDKMELIKTKYKERG